MLGMKSLVEAGEPVPRILDYCLVNMLVQCWILDPEASILDPGSRVQDPDPGSCFRIWSQGPGSGVRTWDHGSCLQDSASRALACGSKLGIKDP